jgi:hypothetical protein
MDHSPEITPAAEVDLNLHEREKQQTLPVTPLQAQYRRLFPTTPPQTAFRHQQTRTGSDNGGPTFWDDHRCQTAPLSPRQTSFPQEQDNTDPIFWTPETTDYGISSSPRRDESSSLPSTPPPPSSLRRRRERQDSDSEWEWTPDLLKYLAESSPEPDQQGSKTPKRQRMYSRLEERVTPSLSGRPDVFFTPTPSTFYTATPGSLGRPTPGRLDPDSPFGEVLRNQNVVMAKEIEINWSGRGQHVEFKAEDLIPLEVEKVVGHSSTALVESVRCRRIRLARKSMRINRRVKLKDIVQEVSYLHKLQHRHIVQLIGTYLQKNAFAILLYPLATGDLTKFLDEWQPRYAVIKGSRRSEWFPQKDLAQFYFCLANALRYMHEQGIRHMDIKPSNILVHERRAIGRPTTRSVYLYALHAIHTAQ